MQWFFSILSNKILLHIISSSIIEHSTNLDVLGYFIVHWNVDTFKINVASF